MVVASEFEKRDDLCFGDALVQGNRKLLFLHPQVTGLAFTNVLEREVMKSERTVIPPRIQRLNLEWPGFFVEAVWSPREDAGFGLKLSLDSHG